MGGLACYESSYDDGGTQPTFAPRTRKIRGLPGLAEARECPRSTPALARRGPWGLQGLTRGYLYSGADVIHEQQSGAVLAQRLTGLGIDERYVRAGELVFTDLLGSTVALSNGADLGG